MFRNTLRISATFLLLASSSALFAGEIDAEQMRAIEALRKENGNVELGAAPDYAISVALDSARREQDSWFALLLKLPNLRKLKIQFEPFSGSPADGSELWRLQQLTQLESLDYICDEISDGDLSAFEPMLKLKSLGLRCHRGRPRLSSFLDVPPLRALESLAINGVDDDDCESLVQMPNLRELTLQRAEITDDGLAKLAEMKMLRSFSLDGRQFAEAGVRALEKLQALESLSLRGGTWGDEEMPSIGKLSNLQELKLPGAQIGDRGFVEIRKLTKLKTLEIPGVRDVTPAGLAALAELHDLEFLMAGGVDLHEALQHIAGLKSLQKLLLGGCHLTDADLVHLRDLTNLEWLFVENNGPFTDAGMEALANLTNLQDLRLGDVDITDAGFANLERCHKLINVMLSAPRLSPAALAPLRNCEGLRQVYLWKSPIGGGGLDPIRNLKQLKYVSFEGCGIRDADLVNLTGHEHLTRVDLRKNDDITNEGLKALGKAVSMPTLVLDSPHLTEQGLSELAGIPNLEYLEIKCPQFTAEGIAPLTRIPSLKTLDLRGPAVCDQSFVDQLKAMKSLNSIIILKIQPDSPLTQADVAKALPSVEVNVGGRVLIR